MLFLELITEFKDHIEMAFVFNCLVPLDSEKIRKGKQDASYNPKLDYYPAPVFILRKCRNSQNPCRIIIDIDERVYTSWKNYLRENKHPDCIMIFPRDGRLVVFLLFFVHKSVNDSFTTKTQQKGGRAILFKNKQTMFQHFYRKNFRHPLLFAQNGNLIVQAY